MGESFSSPGLALDGWSLESSVSLQGVGPGKDKGRIHHCTCGQTALGHQVGVLLWPYPGPPPPGIFQGCLPGKGPSFTQPLTLLITPPVFGAMQSFRDGPRGQAGRGSLSGAGGLSAPPLTPRAGFLMLVLVPAGESGVWAAGKSLWVYTHCCESDPEVHGWSPFL